LLKTGYTVAIFCFSVISSYYMTPLFIDVFSRGQALAKNFRGESIPQGIGIVFAIYSLLWYTVYLLFDFETLAGISFEILIVMTAFLAASFTGFIDDMLGRRDTLGFKGHFGALFSGKLTTGALKALVGGLSALMVSLFLHTGISELIVNTLVITLFTNLLNLMDLRPGRAIKFYMILLVLFAADAAIADKFAAIGLFIPLIGSVIGYFPFDLSARCMMGDAGSNVLGMSCGIMAALQFNIYEKIGILLFLIAIHIFAEKYSLSDVISRNRFLRYIDDLGR